MIGLDPILGSLSHPQGLNRYSHVRNNPLTYIDPSGLVDRGFADPYGRIGGDPRTCDWGDFWT